VKPLPVAKPLKKMDEITKLENELKALKA